MVDYKSGEDGEKRFYKIINEQQCYRRNASNGVIRIQRGEGINIMMEQGPLTPLQKWCSINPNKFKKGKSGNPYGRPKKDKCFSDIARQLLAAKRLDIEFSFPKDGKMHTSKMHIDSDKDIYHALIAALIREGMAGNVPAIKELMDRTDGKAVARVDHTTQGDKFEGNVYHIIAEEHKNIIEEAHEKANGI